MITASLDMRRYEREFAAFAKNSKKSVEDAARENARGVVRIAISVTPPASITQTSGDWAVVIGAKAKKQGEAVIASDLGRVFAPVRVKGERAELHPDLARLHRSRRGRYGRVKRGEKYSVDKLKYRAYSAEVKARVGKLAAGWVPAATQLGVKGVPKWITRHRSPGSARVRVTGGKIVITVRNDVRFATQVGGLYRRLQYAIDKQAGAMQRRVKLALERAAVRAKARS